MIFSSTMIQVFEDEVHKICIEQDLSLLRLTWKQHPTSEQYRKGYRQAILIALGHQVKYWLTDSRLVPYIHMSDQHWMYSKMRPLLRGGKLHKFAIVLQPETLMMTDRKPILDYIDPAQANGKTKKLFNIDIFLDIDSARSWLFDQSAKF